MTYNRFLMKKPKKAVKEVYMHRSSIAQALDPMMYTLKFLRQNEVVDTLEIGEANAEGMMPIRFTVRREVST